MFFRSADHCRNHRACCGDDIVTYDDSGGVSEMAGATTSKSAWPTRKWWAMFITALAAFLISWIQAGEFGKETLIALIGLVAQALVTYLVPNADTPGGVPVNRS
jgi:hypothetical protein